MIGSERNPLKRGIEYYVLKDGVPTIETDLIEWATWMEHERLHVANDRIKAHRKWRGKLLDVELRVSTIFTGIRIGLGMELWETAVFDTESNDELIYVRRCSGVAENAKIMHEAVISKFRGDKPPC